MRANLALLIGISFVASCKKASSDAPAPTASAEATTAVASASPSASATEQGVAAESPSAAAPAEPSASAGATPEVAGPTPLPRAPDGILPKGGADKLIAAGAPARVRLVALGSEPRSKLVYELTPGSTADVAMALAMKIAVTQGEQQLPAQTIPRLTMTFGLTPADKSGDRYHLDLKVTKLGVDAAAGQEQMAAALRPQLALLEGLRVTCSMSPTGEMSDFKTQTPAKAQGTAPAMLDGVTQSLQSLVTPLPHEAIGIGGKWEVLSRVASAGADLVQVATYTLKARSGSKATLDATVKQLAASDELRPPNTQTVAAHLRSLNSSGEGTHEVDLKTAAPQSGAMHYASTMDLEASSGPGKTERTSIKNEMKLEFSGARKAAPSSAGSATP